MIVTLTLNGEERSATVAGWESLLTVLRDNLALPGSKNACEQGECGSCSVILDGENVNSCLVMIGDCEAAAITTVEGIAVEGELHPIQEAILEEGGVQCGFCTPGFVVTAAHLFAGDPRPNEAAIREAFSGNICRCTGYGALLRAFDALAEDGS
ncbi:MAG: (2Fe-2S)-binding protein [Acidimicrobiia bacterium]|nr:MAG: (2Fe-2S)-binding protein [Acidimicrobiia bacterium]